MDVSNACAAKLELAHFRYNYNHLSSNNPYPRWMGAFHSSELEFVFGHPVRNPENYGPEEVQLAAKIVDHWTNFVKTG